MVWTIGAVVAAVVLPVEPTADVETVRDRESAGAILRTTLSAVPRRFEAELMSQMSAGSTTDFAASGGRACASQPVPPRGLVVFGPYVSVDPGRYRVELALRLREPTLAEHVATFEVTTSRGAQVLDRLAVPASRLRADGAYSTVAVSFETAEPLRDMEFRVVPVGDVEVLIDYINLIPMLPQPEY